MLNANGKKKKLNTIQIRKLKQGDRFSIPDNDKIKGVVLSVSDMETNVYWYSIPDHWFKKNYDEDTMMNEDGDFYEGLDIYFYRKKTTVSSSTRVIKLKKETNNDN